MKSTAIHKLSGLALAALLLVPAVPAPAETEAATAAQFDLQLEAALAAQGSDFGLTLEPESSIASEEAAAEISLSEVRAEAWALEEGDDDPAAAMKPKKKGWVRWLKKRWYVPVIAAVALGVALDDDDNDRAGEED